MTFFSYLPKRTILVAVSCISLMFPGEVPQLVHWNIFEFGGWFGELVGNLVAGYAVFHVPANRVYGLALGINGLCTILVNPSFFMGYAALILVKVLLPFARGAMIPALYSVLSQWTPPNERVQMTSNTFLGLYLGYALKSSFVSYMYPSKGRQTYNYISGLFSLFWCLVWFVYVYNTPQSHPKIGDHEKELLKSPQHVDRRVPLWKICTNLPFWCLVLVFTSLTWKFFFIANYLPKYWRETYAIHYEGGGNSLCYVACAIFLRIISGTIEKFQNDEEMNETKLRKIYIFTGLMMEAIGLITIAFCDNFLCATITLTASSAFCALAVSGAMANFLDLAPSNCSILVAIANITAITFCEIASIFVTINYFSRGENVKQQSREHLFFMMSAFNMFAGLVYLLFGSATEQIWPQRYALERNDI